MSRPQADGHRRPNFFLVGAAKSGTTALSAALGEHVDVYLPAVKEPHLYAYLADPTIGPYADEAAARARYAELYRAAGDQAAIGDASTTNLVVAGAAAAIARDVPSARIVAVLRHPVDRAYSHFCHFVAAGCEHTRDFAVAARDEDRRQAEGFAFTYRYLGWSRYSSQLPPFFELFGRDRVLVHLYDDLRRDPEAVLRSTYGFLGVDDRGPVRPVGEHNAVRVKRAAGLQRALSGGPRRRAIGSRLAASPLRPLLQLTSKLERPKPPLDPGLRAELTAGLHDEISRLEDLLGRDLSSWR